MVFEKPADTGPEKLSLQVGEFRPVEAGDTQAARIGKLLAQQIYLALSPERSLLKVKGTQQVEAVSSAGKPFARYVIEGIVTPIR